MKIGLVLSGGFAKGAYQIGVLQAVRDRFTQGELEVISASSIGVLNAYSYATENLERGERMWKSICSEDRPTFIAKIMRNGAVLSAIDKLSSAERPLCTKLYASYLDFSNRRVVYRNLAGVKQKRHSDYLRASIAFPVVNPPVRIGGVSYYDGGLIDNIPVYPLLKMDLDFVICVYFDNASYLFENETFDRRILKLTFPDENSFQRSLIMQRSEVEQMIRSGNERAKFILDLVFGDGSLTKEQIYRNIEKVDRNCGKHSFRVTADMMATNLNMIINRFAERNIKD